MSEYKDGVVGAKSKNLAALRGDIPDWIALPSSVTLPFGCFEQALADPANADVKRRLLESAKLVPDNPAQHLHDCRCVPAHSPVATRAVQRAHGTPGAHSAAARASLLGSGQCLHDFHSTAVIACRRRHLVHAHM